MSDHFPTTRNEFLVTFLRQYFSLPDSMIYYITKNPSSAKVYQKMIQCCKHFFIKNPILVIHCLEIRDDGWGICSNQSNCEAICFRQRINRLSTCKIWITSQILFLSSNSKAAVNFIPKIYKLDASNSYFMDQKMPLQHFLFYAQNVKHCSLERVVLSSDTCSELPIEEIVKNLPNLLKFKCIFGPDSRNVSSDTVKKLLEIPHFKNIDFFLITNISQDFDIDLIYDYYKKNRSQFTFGVWYHEVLEGELAEKLDGIVDEILNYKLYTSGPPVVTYNGQSASKREALRELCKIFEPR